MKTRLLKLAGLAIALVVLCSIALVTVHAQQGASKSGAASTNWVGYLVVGQNDKIDRITSYPAPTTMRQVEIGLRSDGIVIWREKTR
jgi:hypothetical protein